MKNTELKKMNAEELELIAGGSFFDLINEKPENLISDTGIEIKVIQEVTEIYTNW